MTEHLSAEMLNQFADGELAQEQVARANEHLAQCCACTSNALSQMVLKSTTARAGHRYAMPADLRERLLRRLGEGGGTGSWAGLLPRRCCLPR